MHDRPKGRGDGEQRGRVDGGARTGRLVGAADTPAGTVRRFGGNKFPALVGAGHRVTVALSRRTRRAAGLDYGPLPQAVELSPRDGHRVVTFVLTSSTPVRAA